MKRSSHSPRAANQRRLLWAVLLISMTAIAYEILLMRVLSIAQWHHFAWMIISLALLGYGASGSAIALAGRFLQHHFETAFSISALLFSVSMIFCLVLALRVPFNAQEFIWNPRQFLYLAEMYLLLMVPFFFAAACIGMAFLYRSEHISHIYFADLVGAGAGAALVIGVLFFLPPQQAVTGFALLGLAAAVLSGRDKRASLRKSLAILQLAWLIWLAYALMENRLSLPVSQFKELSQALEVVEAAKVAERSGPLGLLTVVESPRIPFRYVPGLSFNTVNLPPEQLAVFTDGGGISVITAFNGDPASLAYLGDVTAALPYRLLHRPRVLVLGAGAGSDVLLALHNGAAQVDAVELNPQLAGLLLQDFSDYSGHIYQNERVSLHLGEARGYAARIDKPYDLVQFALLDSLAASGSGVQALSESYLYTVAALSQYLERLEPGGLLAITRWINVPPRDSLKLAATVIRAMQQAGEPDPGRRIVMIRSWNTMTLLAKKGAFDPAEIEVVREFARQHSFDVAWYPGMPESEANRYNRLDQPWLYRGMAALLSDHAREFIKNYKFNIEPPTDQRPYFFNFFKWRVLPEVLALHRRGGAGLVDWGYLVLVATMVQATLAGLILIILPLIVRRQNQPGGMARRMGGYFFLLGLAFLFVEMAFIQKFILFLSHPLYSVAVVLAGFLVFAGVGSAVSGWLAQRFKAFALRGVQLAVLGIAVIVLLYLWLLPVLFSHLAGQADPVRVLVSLTLIAPLAYCMGMPFPLGLRQVAEQKPEFIPWVWALNGFASVISAALATLLAIELGFNAVLLLALTLYLAAMALYTRHSNSPGEFVGTHFEPEALPGGPADSPKNRTQ
jgi:spermidine synthase